MIKFAWACVPSQLEKVGGLIQDRSVHKVDFSSFLNIETLIGSDRNIDAHKKAAQGNLNRFDFDNY